MLLDNQLIFTQNVAKLIQHIHDTGQGCTFGEVYRTPEQAALNAKSGKGIVNSLHCKRLAVDINLFTPEGIYLTTIKDHRAYGLYWETLHPLNRWGGGFANGDANHYEMQDVELTAHK